MIVIDKDERRKSERRIERKIEREGGRDDKNGRLRVLVSMVSDSKVESRG